MRSIGLRSGGEDEDRHGRERQDDSRQRRSSVNERAAASSLATRKTISAPGKWARSHDSAE